MLRINNLVYHVNKLQLFAVFSPLHGQTLQIAVFL